MKFRKRPIVIDAVKLENSRESISEALQFVFGDRAKTMTFYDCIFIPTLEGTMRADIGDYIIKGISGEFYPCKPDIFEKSYEPVT